MTAVGEKQAAGSRGCTRHEQAREDGLKQAVARGLAEAEERCARRQVRLTRLRRAVLACLLAANGPVKAYELIDLLREKGERLTPATIYRTLDFLLDCDLAHRIAAINAYVPCICEHNGSILLLFVCSRCQRVEAISDPALQATMRSRFSELGLPLQASSIEMLGICEKCADKA